MEARPKSNGGLKAMVETLGFYGQFVMKGLFLLYLLDAQTSQQGFAKHRAPLGFNPWLPFLIGLFFSVGTFQACKTLLSGFVRRNLVATRFKEESEEKRISRLCNDLNGMLYYTCSIVMGYWALRNTAHLPRSFGGTLDLSDFSRAFPSPPPSHAASFYFLFGLGHHLERMLQLLVGKRADGQFWSFYLHHFLTVSLMTASYRTGLMRYGLPVLYLHDWVEPLLNLSKAARELRCLRPTLIPAFICFIVVWGYTRVWAMLWEICPWVYGLVVSPGPVLHTHFWAALYSAFALYSLQLLNLYWFWLLLGILYRKASTGAEHYPSDAKRK